MNTNENGKTIGRRLENVRKMRGWSQAELARQTGSITKSAVEKYENGDMIPTPENLERLAQALGVPVEELLRPLGIGMNYEQMRYRKRSKMSKKRVEMLQRKYGMLLERYVELERLLGEERLFSMDYSDMPVRTPDDARQVALRFREDMGWGEGPVVQPIYQLEERGVHIFILDENEEDVDNFDGMCYHVDGLAMIILKPSENAERLRFTLAHELGHLLMNTGDAEGRSLEKLCDAFASELLLPSSVFRKYMPRRMYYQILKTLQKEYGISCSAQMFKARDLGIITENQYIGYCVQLNRDKDMKEEMNRSCFESETTRSFDDMVYRALSKFKITRAKAASLLGKSVEQMVQNTTQTYTGNYEICY